MENSRIFIKKNRDVLNTKHFQNFIVYYLLFNFVVFCTSFFIVYLSMVFKNILKIFVLFCCMDSRFYEKILQNYGFFKKKLRYLKSIILTKFHCLLFLFYFFSIFGIFFLFHLSKLVQKLWNFL